MKFCNYCAFILKKWYNSRDVYLLYPMIRFEEVEPSYPIGVSYCQSGKTNVHIIKIPFIFEEDEAKMINVLTNELNRILK